MIGHVCIFLDSSVSPSFQFNSIWILQNVLTKPEYSFIYFKSFRYYCKLPMNAIIVQLVKLLNLSEQPCICTICVRCISTIIKGDSSWIDIIFHTNFINVLIDFDDV